MEEWLLNLAWQVRESKSKALQKIEAKKKKKREGDIRDHLGQKDKNHIGWELILMNMDIIP